MLGKNIYIYAPLFLLLILLDSDWISHTSQVRMQLSDEQPVISGGLAWSPDGSMLAVGTSQGVWLHNADDLSVDTKLPYQRYVSSLEWSPDGMLLASGDATGHISIWNPNTLQREYELADQTLLIRSVNWSPDGMLLASASWDNTIVIWHLESQNMLTHIDVANEGTTTNYSLSWTADGTQIVGQQKNDIAVWDAVTGRLNFSWSYPYEIGTMRLSPDGSLLAIGDAEARISVWNISTGDLMKTIDAGCAPIFALAWSPNEYQLASLSLNSNQCSSALKIWDVDANELVKHIANVIMTGDQFYTNAVAWNADGSKLASISDDGKVYIWDSQQYELLALYESYKSSIFHSDNVNQ